MRERSEEFESGGIQLLAVYGQKFEAVRDFAQRERFPFPLIVDEGREVIRRFGVYVRLNIESWNMARPACIGVDRDGVVRFIYVGRNQRDWPKHETIIRALRTPAAAAPSGQATP